MFRNYFKVAFASLIKSRVYSIISISSLSVGLAVCILLLLYVFHELSFDRYHEKSDHIYRLCQEVHPYQAPAAAEVLANKLPEIKKFARILPRDNILIQSNNQRFRENKVAWVDPDLFNIFSFRFTKGNAGDFFQLPGTAVISETTAHKYFGDIDPVGKMLKVGNEYDYTVVGVIEDVPQNSHFTFDIFLTLADGDMLFGKDWMSSWGWQNFLVYFEMQNDFSKPELEAKICQILKNPNDKDAPLPVFTLQQLKDIHLYSAQFQNDIQPQNSINYVLIFSAIGLLILLIASFNYVNLLTANATTRLTEIGMRKAFGASSRQVALQFIIESFVVFIISFIISLVLVRFCLPIFNNLSGKELSFSVLTNGNILLGMFGILLIIGVLAGYYPAFILSKYSPVQVMKSLGGSNSSGFQIKKILIGAQFSIVIILISCSIIMLRQIQFLKQKDLGFEKNAVLTAVFDLGSEEKYNALKQTLIAQNCVSAVSTASRIPSGSLNNEGGVLPEGQTEPKSIPYVHVNFDYFESFGIKATRGRLFSNRFKTDATESIILNEAAVASLEIQGDPIGQRIQCNWPKSKREIVGVIEDIHFESLYEKIRPAVFVISYPEYYHLIVKVKSLDVVQVMKTVTKSCQSIYPDEVIEFSYLDEQVDHLYDKDNKTFQLMGFFALLAIMLASMGLLGMATFLMTSRTKEIGIRKVNGARVSEIVMMLNIGFLKWVAVAFVIATPIAYYSMNQWLASFAYKIALSWWIFALSACISTLIVLLTVSWLTYKAARRNPIESLRYE
ncbi:MAG: ABC transporter permease [Bacteroidales bacterium]|nr:ABC transporter permease [Bacteroidales bacterium]